MPRRVTQEDWLARAVAMHGYLYDYTKSRYIDAGTKVTITCRKHGDFDQDPSSHTRGHGCPLCKADKIGAIKRGSLQQVVEQANAVHGNKYEYPEQPYKNTDTKLTIICPTHGAFTQTAHGHIAGKGCDLCGGKMKLPAEEMLSRCLAAHGDTYDYSKAQWDWASRKVEIICQKHGSFLQVACDHWSGHGCHRCNKYGPSAAEDAVADWLIGLGETVSRSDRTVIPPFEIDIWLPDRNVGIEYHGLYWHTEDRQGNKHAEKALAAEAIGIRLIQIFEDEWGDPAKQVILNAIGRQGDKVMARKCEVVKVSSTDAAAFMLANHVQGSSRSAHHLGLQHDGEVVAVMSFGRPRSARGAYGQDTWELSRYATACSVQGGASRLLTAFLREHPQATIVSYVDHRYFTGGMYPALGFKPVRRAVDYEYLFQRERLHKSRLQKRELEKLLGSRYDPALTEREMAHILGAKRILNAGRTTYIRAPH